MLETESNVCACPQHLLIKVKNLTIDVIECCICKEKLDCTVSQKLTKINYDSAVLIKQQQRPFFKCRHAFPLQKFPDNMEAYSGK